MPALPLSPDLIGVAVLLVAAGALGWWLMSRPPPPPRRVRIHPEHPRLVKARESAQRTLGVFRQLAAQHPRTAMVKVRVRRRDGEYAGHWADVVDASAERVKASLRGPGRTVELPWTDVEDWQVELPSGAWRGAYTVVAALRIREEAEGRISERDAQWSRYLDAGGTR